MANSKRLQALAWLAAAVIALMLLGSGMAGIVLEGGRPLPFSSALSWLTGPGGNAVDGPPLGLWAVAIFWCLLLFAFATFFVSPTLRRRVLQMLPIYIGIALMVYIFARVAQSNQLRTDGTVVDNTPVFDLPQLTTGNEAPLAGFAADPPRWLLALLGGLGLALVLGVGWVLLRRRAAPAAVATPLADLAQSAQVALESIGQGGDLRAVVLRCYQEMTATLQRQQGLERREAMTAREFEDRLADAGLNDDHIRRLTRLFERTRYSGRVASAEDEQEAQACLTAIVATYGGAG